MNQPVSGVTGIRLFSTPGARINFPLIILVEYEEKKFSTKMKCHYEEKGEMDARDSKVLIINKAKE